MFNGLQCKSNQATQFILVQVFDRWINRYEPCIGQGLMSSNNFIFRVADLGAILTDTDFTKDTQGIAHRHGFGQSTIDFEKA